VGWPPLEIPKISALFVGSLQRAWTLVRIIRRNFPDRHWAVQRWHMCGRDTAKCLNPMFQKGSIVQRTPPTATSSTILNGIIII
jgi:hypothetical protein